jgi:tetratricopeptide (TPR) repeat protein
MLWGIFPVSANAQEDAMQPRFFPIIAFPLMITPLPAGALASDDEKILRHPAFQRSEQLIKENRHVEAVAALSEALEKYPEASLGYMGRASANSLIGRWDTAAADAERALQFSVGKGHFETVRGTMAQMYSFMGFKQALAKDFQKSVDSESRALELAPGLQIAYLRRGYSHHKLGKHQNAIDDLTRGMKDPVPLEYQVLLYTFIGRSHKQLGNGEQAQASLRTMVELDPRLSAKYSGDGAHDIYDTETRRRMTIEATAAAEAADKSGNVLIAFQRYEDAWHWPLVVIEIPNQPDIDDYSAADILAMRKVEDALRRLYPRLPAKPQLPEAARRFGVQAAVAAREKRYEEATSLFLRAQRIAPWWPQVNFNLGVLAAKREEFKDAIAYMKTYLMLAPEATDAREAQDKIYEWEMGIDPTRGPKIETLAGTWTYRIGVEKLTADYWYELVPEGENGFELNPLRFSASKGIGVQSMSRSTSGYYSLKLNGRLLSGTLHGAQGQPAYPVSGEFQPDYNGFILRSTVGGKVWETKFTRSK